MLKLLSAPSALGFYQSIRPAEKWGGIDQIKGDGGSDSDFYSDFDKILFTIAMLCSFCIRSSHPLLVIIIHSFIWAFILKIPCPFFLLYITTPFTYCSFTLLHYIVIYFTSVCWPNKFQRIFELGPERQFICQRHILFTTGFKGCRNLIVMICRLRCGWLRPRIE